MYPCIWVDRADRTLGFGRGGRARCTGLCRIAPFFRINNRSSRDIPAAPRGHIDRTRSIRSHPFGAGTLAYRIATHTMASTSAIRTAVRRIERRTESSSRPDPSTQMPMPATRALVWIRRDLRLRDNTALAHACRDAGRGVIAVVVLTPRQWQDHDESPRKVAFWLRNLRLLRDALAERNIPLRIRQTPRFSGVTELLQLTAREHACDSLYFNDEYELNEHQRDDDVTGAFERAGLTVRRFTDRVMFAPGEVLTQNDGYYAVFTPFRTAWLRRLADADRIRVRQMPPVQPPMEDVQPDDVPDHLDGFDHLVDPIADDLWPAGEDHAGNRLRAFIRDRITDYQTRRDQPACNGTSTLSPYLAAGVLSPRQCLRAAIEANDGRVDTGQPGITTWITELIWREFYQHVLVGYPRVCRHQPFRLETRAIKWRDDDAHFEAWRDGQTGYPIVDAAMHQLNTTGWMHNRLRMITAMFLSKNLLLDWRRGERYFMQRLIDGDLGSNNGGWQWSASTGTDAAPYFRVFNPVTQSRKCDPDAMFIRRWCPDLDAAADDLGSQIHEPWTADLASDGTFDYPPPIVDHVTTRKRAIAAFDALKSRT